MTISKIYTIIIVYYILLTDYWPIYQCIFLTEICHRCRTIYTYIENTLFKCCLCLPYRYYISHPFKTIAQYLVRSFAPFGSSHLCKNYYFIMKRMIALYSNRQRIMINGQRRMKHTFVILWYWWASHPGALINDWKGCFWWGQNDSSGVFIELVPNGHLHF